MEFVLMVAMIVGGMVTCGRSYIRSEERQKAATLYVKCLEVARDQADCVYLKPPQEDD